MLPDREITFSQEGDQWVATTPLLSSLKGQGPTREKAAKALRRQVRHHLVELRDRGEELPEPFASDARRKRNIAIAVLIAACVLPPLIVTIVSPPLPSVVRVVDPDKYGRVKSGLMRDEVVSLLGRPSKEATSPDAVDMEKASALGLPPGRVGAVLRYERKGIPQQLDVYLDSTGRTLGKYLYLVPEPAPLKAVDPAKYQQVRKGMTKEQVTKLLGEPTAAPGPPKEADMDRISVLGFPADQVATLFRYEDKAAGQFVEIYFDRSDRVRAKRAYSE